MENGNRELRKSPMTAMQKSYLVSETAWGAVEETRVRMLMDTAAEERLTGKELAERLESAAAPFRRFGRRRMQGSGSWPGELPILASANVLLPVGPAAVRDTVHVAES